MKVILHVGATKTGSSALQNFLYKNMRTLRSMDICYPDIGIASDAHHLIAASLHPSAHGIHSKALPSTPQERKEQFHAYVSAARREAEAMGAQALVLSSEYLWWTFTDDFYATWARALDGAQVTVYAVLRDPLNWVPSSYIQAVKGGEARSLEEWFDWRIETRRHLLDFADILSGWRKLGPQTEFALRSYEELTAQDEIFANLLQLCGVKRFKKADYTLNSGQVNPSPSPKAIELLRSINKSDMDAPSKGSVRKLILTHLSKKKPGVSWDIVDETMAQKIAAFYDPIVERLLSEFSTCNVDFVRGYHSQASREAEKSSWMRKFW